MLQFFIRKLCFSRNSIFNARKDLQIKRYFGDDSHHHAKVDTHKADSHHTTSVGKDAHGEVHSHDAHSHGEAHGVKGNGHSHDAHSHGDHGHGNGHGHEGMYWNNDWDYDIGHGYLQNSTVIEFPPEPLGERLLWYSVLGVVLFSYYIVGYYKPKSPPKGLDKLQERNKDEIAWLLSAHIMSIMNPRTKEDYDTLDEKIAKLKPRVTFPEVKRKKQLEDYPPP